VLVVDDDDRIQSLLATMLGIHGYDVLLASDGAEALQRLDNALPALILLDLIMPDMEAVAFAAELARRGLRPEVPILVLSAHPHPQSQVRQIGAEGCLGKPFKLRRLLDAVARLARPDSPRRPREHIATSGPQSGRNGRLSSGRVPEHHPGRTALAEALVR
jgi:CheY-like chemotaxis protein